MFSFALRGRSLIAFTLVVVKTPSDPAIKDIKYSYVVCSNKAVTVSPSVSEQIAPVVSENTTIVLIQNGIGNEEEFRERFPNNVICSGVVRLNCLPAIIAEGLQAGWNVDLGRWNSAKSWCHCGKSLRNIELAFVIDHDFV